MTTAAWRERREGRRASVYAGLPLVETLVTDLRLTIRMLLARPLFTAIVIAAISIGVGGVATIFSGLNALVLRPLPGVTDGDRLVLIDRRTPDFSEGVSASVRFYDHLREHSRSLVRRRGLEPRPAHHRRRSGRLRPLRQHRQQQLLRCAGRASGGRAILRCRPARRDAESRRSSSRMRPGCRSSSGDPAVVGRSVAVNGRPYQVIGVAPARSAASSLR